MYLALYRKYRPRIFDDVISQDHITTTLKNQLKNGQSSHAYLFTGSRGTGKTTCARILAKALNCTDLKNGNPCLECASCKSIDEDYSDIIEIDAASNNGVDDIRDLKEESFYAPMSGKYKVYIIDEVHMLTTNAFNALLKLIEEPPPHVVFIFATTEVHKVPATILSRCQRFEFRRIDITDSKKRLIDVAEKEGKKLTDDAAFLISKISEGGMRDALSLLDQCFSLSDEVTEDTVRECAGISGSEYLFRICGLIHDQKTRELLILLDELISRSKDVTRLCEELISHFRSLMLIKSGADALAVNVTNADFDLLKQQADVFSLEQIMRCISILSDTFSYMGKVRDPALYLEMCFIKLCTPKLDIDEKAITSRIDRLEQEIEKRPSAPVYNNSITEEKKTNDDGSFRIELPETLKEDPKDKAPKADDLKSAVFGNKEISADEDIPIPPPEINDGFKVTYDESAPEPEEPVQDPTPEVTHETVPLNIWQDIVSTLPMYVRLGIENTTAYICEDNVMIEGGSIAVGLATKDYADDIRKAASKAIGRTVTISAYKAPEDNEVKIVVNDKISDFLDLARSKGINVKEQ